MHLHHTLLPALQPAWCLLKPVTCICCMSTSCYIDPCVTFTLHRAGNLHTGSRPLSPAAVHTCTTCQLYPLPTPCARMCADSSIPPCRSDYPLDSLPPSACIPGSANVEEFKLNVWQQRHAMLLLDTVHQLHDLRFVLCPR